MMYNNKLYQSGVYGVLTAKWKIECQTPLVVRNGTKITSTGSDEDKSRGMNMSLIWDKPIKGTSIAGSSSKTNEVSALYYGYKVGGNKVIPYHFIPPSSIRGSLRSWIINNLVHSSYRKRMSPPAKKNLTETDEYLQNIRKALNEQTSGYQWIASVFGLAYDSRIQEDELSNAGRLIVATTPFSNSQPQPISVNGLPLNNDKKQLISGPINAKRQMTVRNPLDRMTHSSKKGGLHHFLEISKGETFEISLNFLNPQQSDLGLLSLWRREMNAGMLRLGALANIGRGRVSIDDSKNDCYQLWLSPHAPQYSWNVKEMKTIESTDIMSGIWNAYSFSADQIETFEQFIES